MPLVANRELNRFVDQELRSFGIVAGGHVFKGSLAGIKRATGYVRALVAGDVFAGVAYEEADNTGGAGGDLAVRLYTQGDFIMPVNNAAQGWAGAPVYAVDDATASVVFGGGQSACGVLIEALSATTGIVRIRPASAPQVEHVVSAALESLTGTATTNPVLISQRAIKVVNIDVSFNTKPDAGVLDVGTGAAVPNELVAAFDLTTVTNGQPSTVPLVARDVATATRVWARVSAATAAAGVGGMLTVRYVELP